MLPTNTKKQLIEVIKSCCILSGISAAAGFSSKLFGLSFWAAFLLATILQIILGYIITSYVYAEYKSRVYEAELNKLEKLSTILNCIYCNYQNVVTFLPDSTPDFVCEKCEQTNSVKLNFTVARTTSTNVQSAVNSALTDVIKEPIKNHNINL